MATPHQHIQAAIQENRKAWAHLQKTVEKTLKLTRTLRRRVLNEICLTEIPDIHPKPPGEV